MKYGDPNTRTLCGHCEAGHCRGGTTCGGLGGDDYDRRQCDCVPCFEGRSLSTSSLSQGAVVPGGLRRHPPFNGGKLR